MKHVIPAELRRIVAKVDELMALVDALETRLADAHTSAIWFPAGEYQHTEMFELLQA